MKKDEFINKWSLSSSERERRIRTEFIADLNNLISAKEDFTFHNFKKCSFKCGNTELDKHTCQCYNEFKELTK